MVETRLSGEFGVGADLHDATLVEHEHTVGVGERGEAMRDHERRRATAARPQGLDDEGLGLGINRAQRVVEDEQRRVFEQGAGDGVGRPRA